MYEQSTILSRAGIPKGISSDFFQVNDHCPLIYLRAVLSSYLTIVLPRYQTAVLCCNLTMVPSSYLAVALASYLTVFLSVI